MYISTKYYAAVRIDSTEIASPSDSIKNKLADLYKQCLQDIKKALAQNPKNPDLYLLQGVLYLKSGDIKQSIASITEYFRKYNNTVEDLKRIRQNIPEQSREAALFLLFCHQLSQAKKNDAGESPTDLNEEIIKNLFGSDYKDKVEFQDTDIISLINFIAREEKFSECENPLMDMLDYNPFFKDITLNIKEEEKTIYKQIFLQALKIISLLYVNVDCEKRVAHYTRMDVARSLLAANPASPLRLNSIVRTNDPLEGRALLEYLDINRPNRKKDYQSFIGCFVFDYDNLNHFRLYGKNDHQEATGTSLVVNKVFFREILSLLSHTNSYKYRLDIPHKLPLIRCIYIDPASKQFISVGHRRKNSFFRTENELKNAYYKEINMIRKYLTKIGTVPGKIKTFVTGKFLDDAIDEIARHMGVNVESGISQDSKLELLKNQKIPEIHAGLEELIKSINKDSAEMTVDKAMPVIEKIICKREELISVIRYNIYDQYIEHEVIKKVKEELQKLHKMVQELRKELDEEILCQLLLPLRFLIKHASFKEEKECRIYRIVNLRNEKQLISREGYMFIEYGNLEESVYKVIFGAKAQGHKTFQDHLIMKGLENILCEQSKHRIN